MSFRSSYSFVDLPEESSEALIEALNNGEFGEKIFARKAITVTAPRPQGSQPQGSDEGGQSEGSGFGGSEGDCPVTESFSGRLLRLPLHHSLGDDEVAAVVAGVESFRPDGG